ncbi:SprT family zinc-dependent metalloprotease [Roseomonas rosulenta]|uniref:hypothetical protein n=1 Tax=Roseomonas rosulenta TaxID=2748667 RepID=UPI0018E051F0|nr:hypothetical protein [Roseomonas rosulenta]
MATYLLYGISSDRSPPKVSDYVGYKFPESVDVPAAYAGGGTSLRVANLFEAAFAELAECAARRTCDAHFRSLGGGLTLSEILEGWKLYFFAFGPAGQIGQWSATDDGVAFGQVVGTYPATSFAEIGIHITALRSAHFLAGTLLHELAHLAGAPGASASDLERMAAGTLSRADARRLHAAERAVWACGLRSQYKPSVIGALDRIMGQRPV